MTDVPLSSLLSIFLSFWSFYSVLSSLLLLFSLSFPCSPSLSLPLSMRWRAGWNADGCQSLSVLPALSRDHSAIYLSSLISTSQKSNTLNLPLKMPAGARQSVTKHRDHVTFTWANQWGFTAHRALGLFAFWHCWGGILIVCLHPTTLGRAKTGHEICDSFHSLSLWLSMVHVVCSMICSVFFTSG